MANAYSTPQQFNEYQSPYNIELVNGVLAAKQGAYDKNLAVLDENLAQLKTQEGLLLRDKDKEYFNNKVQGLLTEVGRSGQIDLSSNNTTRRIKNYINDAQDEYIIGQIGESQKFRNFQATVEETKKRGKGEGYSDINYIDATERAGLQAYMNGETDALGSLQYKEYVDAPKVINDAVATWAKDHGYRKDMTTKEGAYYDINETKEVLTKDEILGFIKTTLNPQIQDQLQINSRQTYKNYKDEDINNILSENYKVENINASAEIAQLKAQSASATGETKALIDNRIRQYEEGITKRKEKIDNNDFSRDEIHSVYQNNLFNNIAESYDRDSVIAVNYNTTKLEVMKFQSDLEYKAETLKLKKYELDNKNSVGVSNDLGTAIPTVPEPDAPKPDDLSQVSKAFVDSSAQLVATLERDSEEFRNMNKEQKDNFVVGLMKSDNTINPSNGQPLKASTINAITAHKANYEAYSGYRKGVGNSFDKVNREAYDDILGAVQAGNGVNITNLASSMPSVAKLLKAGKSFNNLTEQEKEIVRYEMTASAIVDGGMDDKDSQMYLSILKQRNRKNPQVMQVFDNTLSEDRSMIGLAIKKTGRNIWGFVQDEFINPVSEKFTQVFDGEVEADKKRGRNLLDRVQREKLNNTDSKYSERANTDYYGAFTQDSNITEVEGFETKSGKNLFYKYQTAINASKKANEEKLKPYIETQPEKMSFAFSTENKAQKPMADLINQVIIQKGLAEPSTKNSYSLDYNANDKTYTISYMIGKTGASVPYTTQPIDEALMPKAITDKYSTSKGNWATDINNPMAKAPTYSYVSPNSYEDTKRTIENLNVVTDRGFADQELLNLTYNPIFQPLSTRVETVLEKFPELKAKKQELAKVLSETITVEIANTKGEGFHANIFKTIDGKKVLLNKDKEFVGTTYNPTEFVKRQIELITTYTDLEIKKLKNQ